MKMIKLIIIAFLISSIYGTLLVYSLPGNISDHIASLQLIFAVLFPFVVGSSIAYLFADMASLKPRILASLLYGVSSFAVAIVFTVLIDQPGEYYGSLWNVIAAVVTGPIIAYLCVPPYNEMAKPLDFCPLEKAGMRLSRLIRKFVGIPILFTGFGIFILFSLPGLAWVSSFANHTGGDALQGYGGFLLLAAMPAMPVGFVFYVIGSSLVKTKTAEDVLLRDKRPPILYLRSFLDDKVTIPSQDSNLNGIDPFAITSGLEPFENLITKQFQNIGPVIAISDLSQGLPPPGAARLSKLGEVWKPSVRKLIQECDRVLILAGVSPGVLWEIEEVCRLDAISKTIVVFPPGDEVSDRFEAIKTAIATVGKPVLDNIQPRNDLQALVFRKDLPPTQICGERTRKGYKNFLARVERLPNQNIQDKEIEQPSPINNNLVHEPVPNPEKKYLPSGKVSPWTIRTYALFAIINAAVIQIPYELIGFATLNALMEGLVTSVGGWFFTIILIGIGLLITGGILAFLQNFATKRAYCRNNNVAKKATVATVATALVLQIIVMIIGLQYSDNAQELNLHYISDLPVLFWVKTLISFGIILFGALAFSPNMAPFCEDCGQYMKKHEYLFVPTSLNHILSEISVLSKHRLDYIESKRWKRTQDIVP